MKTSVKLFFATAIAFHSFNVKAQIYPTATTSAGYVPVFTSSTQVTNSMIFQNSNGIGIGINPQKKFQVNGITEFDVVSTGTGGGRFFFNRPSQTNYENIIAFTTGGTSSFDWAFGTQPYFSDFFLSSPSAPFAMTVLKTNGYVGIGNVPTPLEKLHVNGNFVFGPNLPNQRWRFMAQTVNNGKLFLVPDNAGSPDFTKGFEIDPAHNNFIFGMENGMTNIAMGRTSGLSVTNTYGSTTPTFDGNMYLGFNAILDPTTNYFLANADGTHNGSSLIWNNTGGELIFSVMPSIGSTSTQMSSAYVQSHMALRTRWNMDPAVTNGYPQVVIGSQTVTSGSNLDFRLSVDGKIIAKEVFVTMTGWADYVFKKDYQLMPLEQLNNYVKENHHLPEVKSEEEIKKNEVSLNEMSELQMKKIEELTLYLIQMNDKITAIETENALLKKQIENNN